MKQRFASNKQQHHKEAAASHGDDCDGYGGETLNSAYYLIVFLAAFVSYSNTLNAEFVYDDTRCIIKNQDLLPTTPWIKLLQNDFWGTPLSHSGSHKSYRPLCIMSFRLNYLVGGLNPVGYHLVNVVLHAVVSCLFVHFCWRLYKDGDLALFGGLFFALHPIHTEAVAGVVGRADIGAAFFFIASLLLYQGGTIDTHKNNDVSGKMIFLLSQLSAICSTFTKEQGVTILGVLVVYELLFVSRCNLAYPLETFLRLRTTGGLARIFVTAANLITILYLRFFVMGNSLPDFASADNPAANEPEFLTRFLTFLYLPVRNLWLLIYPVELSYDYSIFTVPLVDEILRKENLISCIFYTALVSTAMLFLKYCRRFGVVDYYGDSDYYVKRNKFVIYHKPKEGNSNRVFVYETLNQLALGLALLILPFSPASNLFFYVGFIVAERILYIPSIGFSVLVVTGVNCLRRCYGAGKETESRIRKTLIFVLVLFAAKTYHRNFVWQNEESLYRSGISTSPAKSYSNLGNVLVDKGKLEEGESAYRKALRYRFNMADTHYNLGILLQNSQRYKEAIERYKAAIKYRPRLAAAHLNLGVTLMHMKKFDQALVVFRNASNISDHGLKDPYQHAVSLSHIRYNMGKVLHSLERFREGLDVFLDALKKIPDSYECQSMYNMIGQCYTGLGKHEHALAWYYKALHAKSDHVPAMLTVARAQVEHPFEGKPTNWEDIDKLMDQALKQEPKRMDIYILYGNFLEKRDDYINGIKLLKKALKIEPSNVQILSMLSSFHRIRNENEEALKYLEMSLEIQPENATILMNMGAMYHLIGEKDKAEEFYKRSLAYQPNNQMLLDNIQRLRNQKKKDS